MDFTKFDFTLKITDQLYYLGMYIEDDARLKDGCLCIYQTDKGFRACRYYKGVDRQVAEVTRELIDTAALQPVGIVSGELKLY